VFSQGGGHDGSCSPPLSSSLPPPRSTVFLRASQRNGGPHVRSLNLCLHTTVSDQLADRLDTSPSLCRPSSSGCMRIGAGPCLSTHFSTSCPSRFTHPGCQKKKRSFISGGWYRSTRPSGLFARFSSLISHSSQTSLPTTPSLHTPPRRLSMQSRLRKNFSRVKRRASRGVNVGTAAAARLASEASRPHARLAHPVPS
jgi:hypothetical protein